jgi:hypothetical protein
MSDNKPTKKELEGLVSKKRSRKSPKPHDLKRG